MKIIYLLARNPLKTSFAIIFLLTVVLDLVFNVKSFWIRIIIIVPLAMLLAPKKKTIETPNGRQTQVTWFLLKEPIILD